MQDYKQILNTITDDNKYISENKLNEVFICKYNKQAIDFLVKTNTTMKFELLGQDTSSWNKKAMVNKYRITLKNKKHSYSFEFFDSIFNTENKVSLNYKFYSVLAAMGHCVPESFDEFCSDYGYEFNNETEYIKAKQIHLNCLDEQKNLRKLFTSEELEQLSEIN